MIFWNEFSQRETEMRVFEMTLRVAAENLTTVLDVLKDSADLLTMKQLEGVEAPKTTRKAGGYRNGVRKKGINSRDLILQTVDKGTTTLKQLQKLFLAQGFAETSALPAVNLLIRNGEVVKIADGVYGAVKTLVEAR